MSFDQKGNPSPRQGIHPLDLLAEDSAFARTGPQVAAQNIDRSGLSCAVFPQEAQNPSSWDVET